MKNDNLSLLDNDQIIKREHDQDHDAKRVVIVGGDGKQIADSIKEGLKDLKIEIPASNQEVQEKVVYIPEPRVLEIPTIVKQIEIREIEKPVVMTEVKIVEVERPIIVPEVRIIEVEKQVIVKQSEPMSTFIKTVLILQTLAVMARVFFEIVHK